MKKYIKDLTPKQIVKELDKYIVGQHKAKKAVAIAIRNRYRRQLLPEDLRTEVEPKNIIMIGPTGVGKTEISRRLAQLIDAPFIKVEASRYTEVGYHGRDVESMIRDLVKISVSMVEARELEKNKIKARELAEEKVLDLLLPPPDEFHSEESSNRYKQTRAKLRQRLLKGELDNRMVEIELTENFMPVVEVFTNAGIEEIGMEMQEMFEKMMPSRKTVKRVTVKEALNLLEIEEAKKLIDKDKVAKEGISRAENMGIIFIDEIDKIAGEKSTTGPDVSREGVQRDLLPIVEGTTVMTKYGMVRTDHILFIAAGAFHVSKPSDLIPELQGRFPIRVELDSLDKKDFIEILTKPKNALIKQYTALLKTEGVEIEFTKDAIEKIAEIAEYVNHTTQDIGARRLHTIMEKLLEDISFESPEIEEKHIKIDVKYVEEKLSDIVKDEDLSRYIL